MGRRTHKSSSQFGLQRLEEELERDGLEAQLMLRRRKVLPQPVILDEGDERPEGVLGRHLREEEPDDRAEAGIVGERQEPRKGLEEET